MIRLPSLSSVPSNGRDIGSACQSDTGLNSNGSSERSYPVTRDGDLARTLLNFQRRWLLVGWWKASEGMSNNEVSQFTGADLSPLERPEDRSSLWSSSTCEGLSNIRSTTQPEFWGVLFLRLSPINSVTPKPNWQRLPWLRSNDCVATRYRFPASGGCHAVWS
jgi:hypothetical protein